MSLVALARAMLEALLAGETDPTALAGLARGKLRKKRAQLEQALEGRLQAHHRFLLTTQLAQLDDLDEYIAACDQEIGQALTRDVAAAEPEQPGQGAAQESS